MRSGAVAKLDQREQYVHRTPDASDCPLDLVVPDAAARVFGHVREVGEMSGAHQIVRIMKLDRIKALSGEAPSHIAGSPSIIAPNQLNCMFFGDAPDQVWGADTSDFRTWLRWLYLAVLVEAFSSGRIKGLQSNGARH